MNAGNAIHVYYKYFPLSPHDQNSYYDSNHNQYNEYHDQDSQSSSEGRGGCLVGDWGYGGIQKQA